MKLLVIVVVTPAIIVKQRKVIVSKLVAERQAEVPYIPAAV